MGVSALRNWFAAVVVALVAVGCGERFPAAAAQPELESFRMERTVCFGLCPSYVVEVSRDGAVRYEGKKFVLAKGAREGRVSATGVQRLERELQKINFGQLRDDYSDRGCDSVWTDAPSVEFVARSATNSKKVNYYYGCQIYGLSGRLKHLADVVDEVAGTEQWVGDRSLFDINDHREEF